MASDEASATAWPARLLVAIAALLAIGAGLWHLAAASRGLEVVSASVGGTPITLYRPRGQVSAPLVVIAHGFAGSQQLMQPYAVTLARNGYIALTFDFAGHGRNRLPFVAGLRDQAGRLRVLLEDLERAIGVGLAQPGADGRVALLGHSMAGDALVQYAQRHPGVASALVLVSPYLSDQAQTEALPNLLLLYGALEPGTLHRQGLARLTREIGDEPRLGETYGRWDEGKARRVMLVDGVEHIGVLYASAGLQAALDWLDRAFGRRGEGFIDQRGPWLGLFYLGLVALAWPLAALLPRLSRRPLGSGLSGHPFRVVAIAPAVLTPLILWKLPTDFLTILIGDYLALHFALYGLITGLGLWVARRLGYGGAADAGHGGRGPGRGWPALFLALTATTLYFGPAFALPADRYLTALLPGAERGWIVAALLAGTLIYFTADEWLTRGAGRSRGRYALTKVLFLVSLLIAVLLNLRELFFLIIILPAILVFFTIYGLMSGWVYRACWHPLVGGVASAVVFAMATAVTFPTVGV